MPSAESDPKVVDLQARSDARAQEAWDRYLAAREVAEHSAAIEDGIAAGHAWREFLDLFQSSDQRDAASECDRVVRFRGSPTAAPSTPTPCA